VERRPAVATWVATGCAMASGPGSPGGSATLVVRLAGERDRGRPPGARLDPRQRWWSVPGVGRRQSSPDRQPNPLTWIRSMIVIAYRSSYRGLRNVLRSLTSSSFVVGHTARVRSVKNTGISVRITPAITRMVQGGGHREHPDGGRERERAAGHAPPVRQPLGETPPAPPHPCPPSEPGDPQPQRPRYEERGGGKSTRPELG